MKKIVFNEETINKIKSMVAEEKPLTEISNALNIKIDTLKRVIFENSIKVSYKNKSFEIKPITQEQIATICELFTNSDYTLEKIAKIAKLEYYKLKAVLDGNFTKESQKLRQRKLYSLSKLGSKNPMQGKYGSKHPAFKGECEDGNGYLIMLKPDWYTGRKGSKHVFCHTIKMCEALGISELPKGFTVHHIDGNKKNNSIDNLALMTIAGHGKLHSILNFLSKEQRLSEKSRETETPNNNCLEEVIEDIVHK